MSGGIVILISGRGSNMRALLEQVKSGAISTPVSAVISNNSDVEGLAVAQSMGIATHVVSHRDYPTRENFDDSLRRVIDRYSPKLVVLAGFMRILTNNFIKHYENRLINIHPSLLPAFPGLNTHQRALDAGVGVHGATVHFVVPDVDAGPIITQARVAVLPQDTAASLGARVLVEEHRILPMAVKWFLEDRLSIRDGRVLLNGADALSH
jgi:phosphoribosylglycinamide formyltransferase-1